MTGLRRAAWLLLLVAAPVDAYDAELWRHFPNQNVVTSIAEGETEIYFGTSGGVRRYHRFRQAWLRPITTADGLPDNSVNRITYDRDTGDLAIETRTGTARWMSRLEALAPGGFVELGPIDGIPRIPSSIVPPFGYYITGSVIRGPHRTYRITDVMVDSWNVLWIGTDGLGVGRADLTFNELEFLRSGPLVRNVTALEIDGEDVWVGGQDDFEVYARGMSRFDREHGKWTYYEREAVRRMDDTQVYDILADDTDVWFATERGVVRYRKDQRSWDTYRYGRSASTRRVRRTTSLARGAGRLWLGTRTGLALVDLGADTMRAVGGSEQFRIRDLASGARYVWAATNRGLFRTPADDVTWAPVTSHPAAERPILAVDTNQDTTWVLATSPPALLISTGPDSTWRSLQLPEAVGTTRASLSAAGERAWIGTQTGVLRVNTRSGRLTTLDTIDGLLDDTVHVVRLDGPYVWIGTRQGLSRYHWAEDFADPED